MVGIILATHGNFATGIQQSASMIFGEQPNVAAVTLQPNEGPDDVRKKMEEAVASFEDPQQVLILVDLWGGTPFNQANGLIAGHEDTWAIVAGLNLPMLIDAYASRMMMDTAQELAVQISGSAKEGVRIYPESLEPKEEKKAAKELEKLKEIIADVLNVEVNDITEDTTFVDDLGADSLDIFQIIMGIEDAFDIEIENEDAEKIATVGDAVEQIKNAVN